MLVLYNVSLALVLAVMQQSASTSSAKTSTIATPAESYSGKWHQSKDKTAELTAGQDCRYSSLQRRA